MIYLIVGIVLLAIIFVVRYIKRGLVELREEGRQQELLRMSKLQSANTPEQVEKI